MANPNPSATPAEKPAFQRYQADFAAHIRDPKGHPRPVGVARRRMQVYNDLLFNNVESFLLACFPITRKILGVRRWKRLAREFFASYKCQSPLFRQISEEFVRFLQNRDTNPKDPVFLAHFAHYEWVELAVDIAPGEPEWERIDVAADLLSHRPVLTPTLRTLEYPYPVHRIGPRFQPKAPDPEPTHLVVFRDQEDTVRFVVINVVSARLLALLLESDITGEAACMQIASELAHPKPAMVVAGGGAILEGLRQQGAILGACPL